MKLLPWFVPTAIWNTLILTGPQITGSQREKTWNVLYAAGPAKWSVVIINWKVLSASGSTGEKNLKFEARPWSGRTVQKWDKPSNQDSCSSKQLGIIDSLLFKVSGGIVALYGMAAGSNLVLWVNSRHSSEQPPGIQKFCTLPQQFLCCAQSRDGREKETEHRSLRFLYEEAMLR